MNYPKSVFRRSRTLLPGCFLLSCLGNVLCVTVYAQEEGTECLFEFNNAYSINESGKQQLELAQQQAEANHFQEATKHYQLAIDLLRQSIERYRNLPQLALDCSPTNLSIAKNNAALASDSLEWAESSLNGLDCLKQINEIESLSNLASEYYYDHNDPASAKRTIHDALGMADNIRNGGTCQDDYLTLLNEQQRFAEKIADSLNKRSRFDNCVEYIKSAESAATRARKAAAEKKSAQARTDWQQVEQQAGDGIQSGVCDGLYLKRLENLKNYATRQLVQQAK